MSLDMIHLRETQDGRVIRSLDDKTKILYKAED